MIYKTKLQELREENNLKRRDIDRLLGLKLDTYKNYENENIIIPIKHLNTLCEFFDVSLDYIFNFSNIKKYKTFLKNIDSKVVGNRLKMFRKENNLTQNKLALMLNTANTTISSYELGTSIIATPFLYEICKKYNISADYLLGKIDSPKYLK